MAKTEIASIATDHVNVVRDLNADKEEMERRIQVEREKERAMFSSELGSLPWRYRQALLG